MSATDPELEEIARRLLPHDAAERWTQLLRPSLRLREPREGEQVAVRLGGTPSLPTAMGWPFWDEVGPLCFVASVHAEAVPSDLLDIPFPSDGTLLLFYRDPRLDEYVDIVEPLAHGAQGGARIIYVPVGTPTVQMAAPRGVTTYPQLGLTAETIVNGPWPDHPRLQEAIADLPDDIREFMDDPIRTDDFRLELGDHAPRPRHRIGGFGEPVQGSVEFDVADAPSHLRQEEARRWTLLVQIDSDDRTDMLWGDGGSLYWLMKPHDLAQKRFDRSMFTWQTG